MDRIRSKILAFTLLASMGCYTDRAMSSVRSRAAFDLGCPAEKLEVAKLTGSAVGPGLGTYGVEGCGKKATYALENDLNTPVLNSSITQGKP